LPAVGQPHSDDTGTAESAVPVALSPARIPRNVWMLALASYLRDVASEMLVHLTPLFLANVLGVRLPLVGFIEGLAETTASLTKIATGWWSDRLGRRKGLTVGGYAIAALGVPVLAVAATWGQVLVARFLDRLGKGVRTAPRDALLADSLAAEQRGKGFGLHRAADTAGAFTGLLLAIGLVWLAQRNAQLLSAATFRTVAVWAIIPAVLAPLVVALGVRERARAPGAAAAGPAVRVALDPRFKRLLLVMVLFTLGNSSDAFLVLRAQSAGASVLGVLALLALFNLVYSLVATPLGALSDRMDRRRLIAAGWVLYALVYLGFGLAGGPHALLALAGLWAMYGVYYGLTEGVAKALVADVVPTEARGTAYGLYNAAIGLTLLPASVLAGVLWQGLGAWAGFGPAAPFVFGAALALVAAGLLVKWV
jgi:MFS family permease